MDLNVAVRNPLVKFASSYPLLKLSQIDDSDVVDSMNFLKNLKV